jgi:hypothetical protein
MIFLGMLGLYIAFIVIMCVWVIFLAFPNLMENNLWFVAFLDVIANWVLVWELTSLCYFIESVRYRTMFGMELATLHI